MDEHLGYEKHRVKGNNSGNSHNGYSKKSIKTNYGVTELDIPRDVYPGHRGTSAGYLWYRCFP